MSNPTVNAGVDQTVNDNVPLVLTGTVTQGDYTITGVQWTQDSGPNCAMTAAALWVNTIFELYAGTYVFRFTAWDLLGNSTSDTCQVVVSHTSGPIYISDPYGTPTMFTPSAGGTPPIDITQ